MIVKMNNKKLEELDEKVILLAIIGNLVAIKEGGITIDEAEKFLFSPHMVNRLKESMCNVDVIELIENGCELEDITSLIPEKLNEVIEEMEKNAILLLKKYKKFEESFWLEVDIN